MISTYVEMILQDPEGIQDNLGDLHVCGDDPIIISNIDYAVPVISTYVEMILKSTIFLIFLECDLHVCGDDPICNFKASLRKL